MASRALFITQLYTAKLDEPALLDTLEQACRVLARDDESGQAWSKANQFTGYTSYTSIEDLLRRDACFTQLRKIIDSHVKCFAALCGFDLQSRKLKMHNIWINVMAPGGVHGSHIHPKSVISGTLYVTAPQGSGALQLEDPRLVQMMAAPRRNDKVPEPLRNYVQINPEPGALHLWEGWLRHEVLQHRGESERISISFNYR